MLHTYETVKLLLDQRISELRRTRHTPAFRQGDRYRWFW